MIKEDIHEYLRQTGRTYRTIRRAVLHALKTKEVVCFVVPGGRDEPCRSIVEKFLAEEQIKAKLFARDLTWRFESGGELRLIRPQQLEAMRGFGRVFFDHTLEEK